MTKYLDHQKAKDGQLRLDAQKAIGGVNMMTLKATHILVDGRCLCGSRAKLTPMDDVPASEMPPLCGRCENRLEQLIQEKMRELVREYWTKPARYGGAAQFAPEQSKKKVPVFEQEGLPAELLPVGSGELLGEVGK